MFSAYDNDALDYAPYQELKSRNSDNLGNMAMTNFQYGDGYTFPENMNKNKSFLQRVKEAFEGEKKEKPETKNSLAPKADPKPVHEPQPVSEPEAAPSSAMKEISTTNVEEAELNLVSVSFCANFFVVIAVLVVLFYSLKKITKRLSTIEDFMRPSTGLPPNAPPNPDLVSNKFRVMSDTSVLPSVNSLSTFTDSALDSVSSYSSLGI